MFLDDEKRSADADTTARCNCESYCHTGEWHDPYSHKDTDAAAGRLHPERRHLYANPACPICHADLYCLNHGNANSLLAALHGRGNVGLSKPKRNWLTVLFNRWR